MRPVVESSALDGADGTEDFRGEGDLLAGERLGCIVVLMPPALCFSDLEGLGGEICFVVAGDLGISGLQTGDAAFGCDPAKDLAGTGEEDLLLGLKRD